MNQRSRFLWATLLAVVLHATAMPLLINFGLECPARLAGERLAEEGIAVSFVTMAQAEQFDLPLEIPIEEKYVEEIPAPEPEVSEPIIESEEIPVIEEPVTETPTDEESTTQEEVFVTENVASDRVSMPRATAAPRKNNPPVRSENAVAQPNHANRVVSAAPVIDVEPALISNPRPPYPADARRAGIEGVVYLKVSIDNSGKVSQATLVRSSGRKDFDEAALKTVREQWRFRPARSGGTAVSCERTISVEFRLR